MPTADTAGAAPESRDLALDGLRGLAIALVVVYHSTLFRDATGPFDELFVALPRLGWSGVDLFFVLSGFLITRILLRHRGAPNYFGVFYARRVLRIFPLYYALLAVLLWVVPRLEIFAASDHFWTPGSARETLWYWLYLSNFQIAAEGAFQHRFLHLTWSLAIEEQFYLTWPLLVWWLPRRALLGLCAAAVVGAFALRCGFLWSGAHPLAVYVLTPLRMDPIACGAAVALLHEGDGDWRRLDRVARRVLPAAGATLLVLLVLLRVAPDFLAPRPGLTLLSHPLSQTFGYTALAVFYAALLVRVMAADASSSLRRSFESHWLRVLGRYSYAMYLLHVPVIAFTTWALFQPRVRDWPFAASQAVLWALVLGLSLGVARVSWSVLEAPALRLRRHFRYREASPERAGS